MSQSVPAARRMAMGAEAAKGCDSFLCEQRIESNWRILLTMTSFLLAIKFQGSFPQEPHWNGRIHRGAQNKGSRTAPLLRGSGQLCAGRRHARSFGRWRLFRRAVHLFLLARLPNVNRTLEPGAVLDGNSLAGNIAPQGPFVPDVQPVAGRDVAFYLAQHHDFLGGDVGLDLAVAANRDTVTRQIDGAFHASIDVKRLRARHLALNDE